jgi:3-dehydroquinate synthase
VTDPIVVASSRGSYPVLVADGALAGLRDIVRGGAVFAVAGAGVLEHHRDRIEEAIGRETLIAIQDGEGAKTLASIEALVEVLIARGARRDSTVVAIGGGTVGDSAGFAASILFRGVDLVHVPTTLLAQIDSSIGGKVGINHPRGKNLIGSFWPPRAVVVDPAFLATLPPAEFLSGAFEALKCGVILDEALFDLVRGEYHTVGSSLEEVVRRAIAVKAAIVSEDERERDRRRLLNYGHTIGHAIEAAIGFGTLTHGEAVAWGMIGANAIAARRGLLPPRERNRIDGAVRGLSPRLPDAIERSQVLAAAGTDKKITARGRAMALPLRVGECAIVEDVSDEELRIGIDAALAG